MDHEGQIVLLFYGTNALTPKFYLWKDGLKEEKYG